MTIDSPIGGLGSHKTRPSAAVPRTRRRVSEDEKIAELQAKIARIEERKQRQEAKQSPLGKDFERFKKHAHKFVQACLDDGRNDLANSVLGVVNVTESQLERS